MEYEDLVKQGLNGDAPLKLILCGRVEGAEGGKTGVVEVVYATMDRAAAEQKIHELVNAYPDHYYMVYSVPTDVDLTTLSHYPSIAITPDDLL